MEEAYTKKQVIMFSIIILLFGFCVGYGIGFSHAVHIAVDTAKVLLDMEINPAAMTDVLQRFPEIHGLIKIHNVTI